jgi:hypothetical protein
MTKFGIGVSQGKLSIHLDENLEETDITEMLSFREEEVEKLLCTHAGVQSYWEALAIRLKVRHERFKDEWSKKWWAHNRRFAKYLLESYGDKKPTAEALKDAVIQIYSSDTTDPERQKYAFLAWGAASKNNSFYGSEDEFRASMYKFLYLDSPWYFETVVTALKNMQEEFEIVESVADRLNSQGFHLDLYAKMMMARKYNIGAGSISDAQVANLIGRGENR